jgi:hypothetical protein
MLPYQFFSLRGVETSDLPLIIFQRASESRCGPGPSNNAKQSQLVRAETLKTRALSGGDSDPD